MHIESTLMVHAFCQKAHGTATASNAADGRRTYGVTVAERKRNVGRRTFKSMYVIGVSMAQRRGNDADMPVMIGEYRRDDV